MIFVTDAAGLNLYSSPDWQHFTGQPAEDTLGYGWASQVHPSDLFSCEKIVREAVRLQSSFTTHHRLNKVGHGFVWIVGKAEPLFHPQNHNFLGFVGSITETDCGDESEASGSLGGPIPPASPSLPPSTSSVELAIDHLLIARSLLEVTTPACGAVDLALYLLRDLARKKPLLD